jgi:hypothetical protein
MNAGPVPAWPRAAAIVAAVAGGVAALPATAAEPIGAARCGTCHPKIYASWRTTAHARSLESLTDAQREDPTCRACHTLEPGSADPALQGVQCESCHGAGSLYSPEHVMRDPRLARLLGLADVDASTCRACHEGVSSRLRPYDWRSMVEAMGHAEALRPGASKRAR